MSMEIEGKIATVLPLETGSGKNGEWQKQPFVLETDGKYPKKVCIEIWGDRVDENKLKEGEGVKVSIEVESREYNNRWYTSVRAWRIEKEGNQEQPATTEAPGATETGGDLDDLPF